MPKQKPIEELYDLVHQGPAHRGCPCAGLEGERCPDCRHLLTARPHFEHFGEMSIEHAVITCSVCGRRILSDNHHDTVRLDVHDASQKNSSKF